MNKTPIIQALTFYNEQQKQNRSRAYCYDDVCTFELVVSADRILPFHLTRTITPDPVTLIELRCYDGAYTEDITSRIQLFYYDMADGTQRIVHRGNKFVPKLPCGKYEIYITDGPNEWWSEIITVYDFTPAVTGKLLYTDSSADAITTSDVGGYIIAKLSKGAITDDYATVVSDMFFQPLRVYNTATKLNYLRDYCYNDLCTFSLATPVDRIPPFIFRRQFSVATIQSFKVICYDGGFEVDYTNGTDLGGFQDYNVIVDGTPVTITTYNGQALTADMPCGKYTAEITYTNGEVYTTEIYTVMTDLSKLTKFTYFNSCDMGNVLYSTGYQSWFFMDITVNAPDELIEEEVQRNGDEEEIVTFRRQVKRHKIVTPLIPEFMCDAIERMKSCDTVRMTFPNGEILDIKNIQTEKDWFDTSNCYAIMTITFDVDEVLINTACCTNLERVPCLVPEDCEVEGILDEAIADDLSVVQITYPLVAVGQRYLIYVPTGTNIGTSNNLNIGLITDITGNVITYEQNVCGINNTTRVGKLIHLDVDNDDYYSDGTFWWMFNNIYSATNSPVIIKGRAAPNIFIQVEISYNLGVTWQNYGAPLLAEDFDNVGLIVNESLAPGTYMLRCLAYNNNCDYGYSKVFSWIIP